MKSVVLKYPFRPKEWISPATAELALAIERINSSPAYAAQIAPLLETLRRTARTVETIGRIGTLSTSARKP
jgi:hypothetical protein